MSTDRCPGLDILSPFTDGELSPAKTVTLRRHLTGCARCKRRIRALRGLDGLLFTALREPRRPRLLPVRLATVAAGLLLGLWLVLPHRTPTASPPVPPSSRNTARHEGVVGPSSPERVDVLVRAEIEGLRDPARRLPRLGFAARRHLRARLTSEDPRVAQAALHLTAEIRDRVSVRVVASLLEREDLAAEAAHALGEIGDDSAASSLAAAFRAGRAPVESLAALVKMEAGETIASLLADTTDPEPRAELLRASGRLPAQLAAPLLARYLDAPLAGEILAAARDEHVPVLRRRLAAGDIHAAHALGLLKDGDSLSRLVRFLDDPVRRPAGARALAAFGTKEALDALFAAAGDGQEDPVVLALGSLDADRHLAERFANGRHRERLRAVRLMGLCCGNASLAPLGAALADPALADEAVRSLGRLGVREVGAVALLARAGGIPALRTRVIRALGETGRAEAVPVLRGLAVNLATTRATMAALANIPDDEAIRALLDMMDRPRHETAARRALRRQPADRVALLRSNRERGEPLPRSRVWPEI